MAATQRRFTPEISELFGDEIGEAGKPLGAFTAEGLTKAAILSIKDQGKRRRAILEYIDLFR